MVEVELGYFKAIWAILVWFDVGVIGANVKRWLDSVGIDGGLERGCMIDR